MKTMDDLTPEIREKIEEYKKLATRDLYSGVERENFNRKDASEYISYVYELAKYSAPINLFASDPKEFKIFFHLMESDRFLTIINIALNLRDYKDSNDVAKFDSTYKSLVECLSKSYEDGKYREYIERLQGEILSEIKLEFGDLNLGDDVASIDLNIPNSIDVDIDALVKTSTKRSHWLAEISVYSRVYFMWYYFIHKEFNIDTTKSEELTRLYNTSRNGIMRSYLTNLFTLSLIAPEKITRTQLGLHDVNGPAIKYPNNSIYFIGGVNIGEEYFKKISDKTLTVEEFFRESNNEIRSAMVRMIQEKYGDEYLFDFFRKNLSEVDTYIDKKDEKYLEGTTGGMNLGVYTLFKGEINGFDVAYVRCYCPSSDRMFFLGVDPSNTKADDAIASLYRVPVKLVNHIKYIQRQGERFTTVFDEKGNEIMKAMTKEDAVNTTTINGETYFKLMRYEY